LRRCIESEDSVLLATILESIFPPKAPFGCCLRGREIGHCLIGLGGLHRQETTNTTKLRPRQNKVTTTRAPRGDPQGLQDGTPGTTEDSEGVWAPDTCTPRPDHPSHRHTKTLRRSYNTAEERRYSRCRKVGGGRGDWGAPRCEWGEEMNKHDIKSRT